MMRGAYSAAVYGVATVFCLLSLNLTQIETATLRKVENRDGLKEETSTSRLQEGVIVFGKGPNTNNNASGDPGYQADTPGGSIIDALKAAQWNNVGSSLQCGPNFMKFGVAGSQVNQFDFGQNPAAYHVEKHPHGTSLYIPFKGCYIVYEDATYNYPIKWHGIPLTLKCPKPQVATTPVPYFPWKPTTPAPVTLPYFPPFFPIGWNPHPPTPTPSATIPLHYQTYFQYVHYLLYLLNAHSTPAPPQALYLQNVINSLLQLLHDHLSSTTPSLHFISYLQQVINHLLQLLFDLYHPTTHSQVPDPQLPHIPWYFNHLQHATTTSAPQNPLAALFGKLPMNYPPASTDTVKQLNPSLLLSMINAQSAKAPPQLHNPYGHLPWNPPGQTPQTGPHPPLWFPQSSGQVHVLPKHQGTLQKS